METDIPALSQLIADYHSLKTLAAFFRSRAKGYEDLFNCCRVEENKTDYQERAIGFINAALVLETEMSRIENIIHKIPSLCRLSENQGQ